MTKTILILLISQTLLSQEASKNEWRELGKALTPEKKEGKLMVKPESDSFSDLRGKTSKEFEKARQKVIKQNKKAFQERLYVLQKAKQEKDNKETEKILKNLQSGQKTNIKFWLQAQRYMKEIAAHLQHL